MFTILIISSFFLMTNFIISSEITTKKITIQEFCFIETITQKIIPPIIQKNFIFPKDITQYIKLYSLLCASSYFEKNFKAYYNSGAFQSSWEDFNVPLQLYPRLSLEQKNILSTIFLQYFRTDNSVQQQYITDENRLEVLSKQKTMDNLINEINKTHNITPAKYYLISWKNYKKFVLLPEELRKCLCYLPSSINPNKTSKQYINPQQGICISDINYLMGLTLSKNQNFNGYPIMPLLPDQKCIPTFQAII